MIIRYFANHYSNSGNWTHIVDIYNDINEFNNNLRVRLELYRADHILKVLRPALSNIQKERLKMAMKWREDLMIDENGQNPYSDKF